MKHTLGQAIDAMRNGKVYKMGDIIVRIVNQRFECMDPDDENDFWSDDLPYDQIFRLSNDICEPYELPIKWKKATWLEALEAAFSNKRVKEQSIGHERELTKEILGSLMVDSIRGMTVQYYIEDTTRTKWKKVTPIQAMEAAYQGKRVKENDEEYNYSKELTKDDFALMQGHQIANSPNQYYIEE
jgi:hypothetical protein